MGSSDSDSASESDSDSESDRQQPASGAVPLSGVLGLLQEANGGEDLEMRNIARMHTQEEAGPAADVPDLLEPPSAADVAAAAAADAADAAGEAVDSGEPKQKKRGGGRR